MELIRRGTRRREQEVKVLLSERGGGYLELGSMSLELWRWGC